MEESLHSGAVRVEGRFSTWLSVALALPAALSAAAWLLQLIAKFPPRSPFASVTALIFAFAPLAELIAVPIATKQLIERPALRTWKNVVLTLVGALTLLLALLIVAALAFIG